MELFMQEDVFEAYKYEYSLGAITLGSSCNIDCFYCSNKHNPPGLLADEPRLSFDEITGLLKFLPAEGVGCIGSSQLVSGGEFFSHPNAVDVLRYIKDTGIRVRRGCSLFTNGMLVREEQVKAMVDIGIRNVVLHVCNLEEALPAFKLLHDNNIDVMIGIVPNRVEIDNGEFARWMTVLAEISDCFSQIKIFRTAYTRYTPKKIQEKLSVWDEEIRFLVRLWQEQNPNLAGKINYQGGELHEIYIFRSIKRFLIDTGYRSKILFLTSNSVEHLVRPIVNKAFRLQHCRVVPVENNTFGGNISIAGLLCAEDYISAIKEVLASGFIPDVIVIPRGSFPINAKDLKGTPVDIIKLKFNIDTFLC